MRVDENCEFRVITSSLGLGKDQWAQIRRNLLDKFQSNKSLYLLTYENEGHIAEFERMLNYFNDFPRADH